jgi:hypothetical protein
MHSHTLADWRHDHVFLGAAHERNERRTWAVVGLTAVMMVAEIVGGIWFGSVALIGAGAPSRLLSERLKRPPRHSVETTLAHWFIGGLLTIGLLVSFGSCSERDPLRLLLLLGGLTVVMLPISPVSHTHYFCLALPAVIAQLAVAWRPGSLRPSLIPFGAALLAGILFALPMIPFCDARREIGLSMMGCLLLWGMTVRQLSESRISVPAHFSCPAPTT